LSVRGGGRTSEEGYQTVTGENQWGSDFGGTAADPCTQTHRKVTSRATFLSFEGGIPMKSSRALEEHKKRVEACRKEICRDKIGWGRNQADAGGRGEVYLN